MFFITRVNTKGKIKHREIKLHTEKHLLMIKDNNTLKQACREYMMGPQLQAEHQHRQNYRTVQVG